MWVNRGFFLVGLLMIYMAVNNFYNTIASLPIKVRGAAVVSSGCPMPLQDAGPARGTSRQGVCLVEQPHVAPAHAAPPRRHPWQGFHAKCKQAKKAE